MPMNTAGHTGAGLCNCNMYIYVTHVTQPASVLLRLCTLFAAPSPFLRLTLSFALLRAPSPFLRLTAYCWPSFAPLQTRQISSTQHFETKEMQRNAESQ